MVDYNQDYIKTIKINNVEVFDFVNLNGNLDEETVNSFGDEWQKFNHFTDEEIEKIGDEYFDIVPESILNSNTIVLDVGCGTGRWSKYLANKVKFIEAIDPSEAIISACQVLKQDKNVRVTKAATDNIPFNDQSFDFAISLGVLHHIPDTKKALHDMVQKVKIHGHVLIYIYYSLDNRGFLFKLLFFLSNIIRFFISKLPKSIKQVVCELIAIFIYYPFIFIGSLIKSLFPGSNLWKKVPLSYYIGKSYNVVRNDTLDRFGTPLEQRFSKNEIYQMMIDAGLSDITFSQQTPYWHAFGTRIK